jgi:hypothetical protein
MVNSRNKGAQFERDVAKILNEFFEAEGIDYQTKRNLDQYQGAGQCDLNMPYHAVECKFYKEGTGLKSAWWNQVCESAQGRIPVLIFKFNRRPIQVCIPLHAINTEWEEDNKKIAYLCLWMNG